MSKLPTKLLKEPLIEAIFQLRFKSKQPASTVIPGYLFSQLNLDGAGGVVETMDNYAAIPLSIRENDPNLKYHCFIKINWGKFLIVVGDRAINIACSLPYAGWEEFKEAIITVVKLISKLNIIEYVERHSLKYVDLVPSESIQEQVSMTNLDLTVANTKLTDQSFSLVVNIPRKDAHHIVTIVTNATVNLPDEGERKGLVIDIDSIVQTGTAQLSIEAWINDISSQLDILHQTNKEMFFECLSPEAIDLLEPEYE